MSQNLLSNSGLSFERLEAFLEIAEAEGISRAAKGNPSRQSQFSRQLSELEKFFGIQLAQRGHSTSFRLTEAGRRLKAIASQNFASLDELRQAAKEGPIVIRVGAGESLLTWVVIPVLAALPGSPSITYQLLNRRSAEILEALDEGAIELGLVRRESASGLAVEVLGNIEMVLVKPKTLARCREKGLPIAAMDKSIGREDVKPSNEESMNGHLMYLCTSYHQMAELARSGRCATILPRFMTGQFRTPEFVLEPFQKSKPLRLLAVTNPRVLELRPRAAFAITKLCAGCSTLLRQKP